jgi:hypothetical protein
MPDQYGQQLDGVWMQAQFRLIDKYQRTSILRGLKKESGEGMYEVSSIAEKCECA